MLLRRIVEHIKAQDWTAVALDFVIVVVGVFIGIQVANWNSELGEREQFQMARERFSAEATANLATLEDVDREMRTKLSLVRGAFDALRSCDESQDNRALISRGLWAITGSTGITMRMSALEEITESQHLSSRLSKTHRKQLDDLKFALTLLKREAHWMEDLPLRERSANNPLIAVGELDHVTGTYQGIELSGERRMLMLAEPIDVACQDNAIIKSFYHWERFQEQILRYIEIQKTMIMDTMIALGEENWTNTE